MNVITPLNHLSALLLFFIFLTTSSFAQVGIGNTDPKSILDIEASNQSSPSNKDGLLIPRIDAFPSTSPGADQDGMLVYLTTDDTITINSIDVFYPGGAFYFWENNLTYPKWNSIDSNNVNEGNHHYVGELYGGGIVCYVYNDGVNGLIASLTDLNSGNKANWANALTYASNHNGGGNNDWYLPDFLDLKLLYEAAYAVNSVLGSDGLDSISPNDDNENYWTSLAKDNTKAYIYKTKDGHFKDQDKTKSFLVRAVRSF